MSDYVPDATKQVRSQVESSNNASLITRSSGPASVNISDSKVNLISGDHAQLDGKYAKGDAQRAQTPNPSAIIEEENSQKLSVQQDKEGTVASEKYQADDRSESERSDKMQSASQNIGTLVGRNAGQMNIYGNLTFVAGNEARINNKSSAERDALQGQKTANVHAATSKNVPESPDLLRVATINKSSWETTSAKITDDCNDEKLNEPDFQVHPQMMKVEDYYKGGYAEIEPEIVEEQPEGCLKFFRKPKNKVIRNQCIKERGFNVKQSTSEGHSITIESLLKSIMRENNLKTGEKLGVTAVVASAGSGKTTLLRRLARKVMRKNDITEENSFSASSQSRFDMVHYTELKSVQDEGSISVADFLFGGMFKTEKDVEDAYDWLIKNQSNAVLFLDGLDQTVWKIDKTNQVDIKPHQKASPATIMYNLLSRNLLPHLQIVISSREFAVSALQANSRPKKIVTLTGLSQGDAKKLFIALVGENGEKAWNKLSTASRGLLHFISIPVFLILAAIVMSRDSDSPPPDTVTGLFVKIMEILPGTENIQERKRIIEILNKLKKMAHKGMVQGRVVFYEDDLQKHGLTIEDVRDLMVKVPGKNILTRYLLEEHHYILFFFHQSFQEFLSACLISEMSNGDFWIFDHQNLHEDRWSVVRRFSCGLIHDENLSLSKDLHKIGDKKEKQRTLRKSLASRLRKAEEYQSLELYGALYESNNSNLVNSIVRQIKLNDTPLGIDGAHTLSSMMARCEEIDLVYLHDCKFNDNLLRIMAENMRGHKVQVKAFDIQFEGFTIVGLNSLLENMIVDTFKTEIKSDDDVDITALNWEVSVVGNIPRIASNDRLIQIQSISQVKLNHISMTKGHDSFIKIKFNEFTGTLSVQDKMLQVDAPPTEDHHMLEYLLDAILNVEKLLKPNSVKVVLKKGICQQYLKYNMETFQSFQNWEFEGKIEEILHNHCESFDSSLIASTIRLFPLEVLDIAVHYKKDDVMQANELRDQLSRDGCKLNIHWCCRLYASEDLRLLASSISQNPVDNLRLYIRYNYPKKDLKTFIEECKAGNLSVMLHGYHKRSKSDKRELIQTAESSEIHLEIRKGHQKDCKGVWGELDRWILYTWNY